MTGRSELVDVCMQVHHATERAILVSDDGKRDNAVWLPLSVVEVELQGRGSAATITMPEWLAYKHNLI